MGKARVPATTEREVKRFTDEEMCSPVPGSYATAFGKADFASLCGWCAAKAREPRVPPLRWAERYKVCWRVGWDNWQLHLELDKKRVKDKGLQCKSIPDEPILRRLAQLDVLSEQRDHFQRELVRAVNYGYRLSGGA